jgi:hypothetical protein
MQPISKKLYSEFKLKIKNIIISFNFDSLEFTERGYKIKTSLGVLNINIWDKNINYSIFTRFDIENFDLHTFKIIFPLESINPFTLKWNIHSDTENETLSILENRLKILALL